MLYRLIEKTVLILLGFIFALVAIVVCDHYCDMKSDFWHVSFIDLLQLFTNLFIAIIIVYYLRNRYSDKQMQKNLFLEIANDTARVLENASDILLEFMQQTTKPKNSRIKVLLLLKRISNKITVLEKHDHRFNSEIKKHVIKIREHFDIINETIGENNFVRAKSFPDNSINIVLKNIYDIIFLLDQIKLNIFD